MKTTQLAASLIFCLQLVAQAGAVLPDSATAKHFGSTLANNGKQLFIGNAHGDSADKSFAGEVHLWDGGNLTAIEGPKEAGARFGQKIATVGDWLFISAPCIDKSSDHVDQGLVLVFQKKDGKWQKTQCLRPPEETSYLGEKFGSTLCCDGETLAIASKGPSKDRKGKVYLYHWSSDGAWENTQQLAPDDLAKGDFFGTSLLLHDKSLLVGCPADKSQGWQNGAVHVFKWRDRKFVRTQKIFPRKDTDGLNFGLSMAIAGDRLAISQPGFTKPNEPKPTGAVSFFKADPEGNWKFTRRIENPLASTNGKFGYSLHAHDDRLLISAPYQGTTPSRGGAVFLADPKKDQLIELTQGSNKQKGSMLGYSLTVQGSQWLCNQWGKKPKVLVSDLPQD